MSSKEIEIKYNDTVYVTTKGCDAGDCTGCCFYTDKDSKDCNYPFDMKNNKCFTGNIIWMKKEEITTTTKPVTQKQNIHAELMQQYLEDWKVSNKPWETWEMYYKDGEWIGFDTHPTWDENIQYRRKNKRKVVVNGVEVNVGMDEKPKYSSTYYVPSIVTNIQHVSKLWFDEPNDNKLFESGVAFDNKEDAIAMAKAMLSFKVVE
jgi:hypothetical protein